MSIKQAKGLQYSIPLQFKSYRVKVQNTFSVADLVGDYDD